MGLSELILYAVPTGPLAQEIASYFALLADRPTEAQRFPAHCTLTGFFHDAPASVETYAAAAASAVAAEGPTAVWVRELGVHADWIGLELESPGLKAVASGFAARTTDVGTRADPIRLKDWLHLSLAYGHGADDHGELAHLARERVDPGTAVAWDLCLYERRGLTWITHGRWPCSPAGPG